MRLLAEIDRRNNVPHSGRIVHREAVRAIIPQGNQLLMVHSKVNGDFKFPGGGVQRGELHETALRREIEEESGAKMTTIVREFGKTIEYDFSKEKKFDVFCMSSYYYICKIAQTLGSQNLDAYEAALGFSPVWVEVDEAIRNNRNVLAKPVPGLEKWVKRETEVLGLIKQELFQTGTYIFSSEELTA